jgi:hypothetical protein
VLKCQSLADDEGTKPGSDHRSGYCSLFAGRTGWLTGWAAGSGAGLATGGGVASWAIAVEQTLASHPAVASPT